MNYASNPQYDYLAFEHLHHWTKVSFTNLLNITGFEIVSIDQKRNSDDSGNPENILRILAKKLDTTKELFENDYKNLIIQIIENSNIQHISKDKDESQVLQLLDELINDFKEQTNLKKIESLERELLNNLDENSYSELIRLKNQLNRD